jgi:hypothetical protein
MRCEKCGERIDDRYYIMTCFRYEVVGFNEMGLMSEIEDMYYDVFLCKICWIEFKQWLNNKPGKTYRMLKNKSGL